jgi:hypothetical protein
MDVVKIVLPVTASLLVLVAAAMYLVWKCRLRGRATLLLRVIHSSKFLQNYSNKY